MSSLFSFDWETAGVSNGTAMTTANSAFKNLVQAGWTFSNTHLLASGGGSFAGRCAPSGATAIANDTGHPWSAPVVFYRFYAYIESAPTATTTTLQFRNGGSNQADIRFFPTGEVQIRNNAFTQVAKSGTLATAGSYIRVEGKYDGPNGQQQLKVFAGANLHSTTATYDSGLVAAATGGLSIVDFQFGAVTSSTMAIHFDNLAFDNANWLGSVVSVSQPPTVNAGADQSNLEPWSQYTLTGLVTPGTGTVTGTQWTQISGTSVNLGTATTNPVTVTLPPTISGDNLVFQFKATDSNALSATDTVQLSVLPVTERAPVNGVEVPIRVYKP